MRYFDLPGTDLKASAIVLGCAWFGTDIPEDRAFALMDAFTAQGGNFLDTAHMYASWVTGGSGKSETTIGKWLKRVDRSRVRIGTKGADQGMTREGIRRQLAESLSRLDLPSVDLYWLHSDDPAVPVGPIIDWLNELVQEGKMLAFGCSNWRVPRIREAMAYAKARGLKGFAASQIACSLARVNPEAAKGGSQVFMDDDTLAFHRAAGLPLVAYSSQAGGFFAGKYDPAGPSASQKPNPAIVRYYGTAENYARLAAVKKLAAKKKLTPNQIALAYLTNQRTPTFAIAGAGTVDYVLDSCGAGDVVLSSEELAMLEQSGR